MYLYVGHDIAIHSQFYRKHPVAQELGKISGQKVILLYKYIYVNIYIDLINGVCVYIEVIPV